MIETIYSSDKGDAERTGSVAAALKMPKNVRQIGKSNSVKKIYIEDYAMSYIRQLAGEDYTGRCMAVLVGQCVKVEGCRNIFISGVVKVKDTEALNEFSFTNETWTGIYEDIKKYFTDFEIVGWFIGGPGYLLSDEDKILKTHVDNFAGQDKVLLIYDNLEKDEAFYCYESNRLNKQEGYYIYYEKNDEMQTYIIDHKEPVSCEAGYDDKVSRDIRTTIQNKQAEKDESKSVTRLMYAAGTLLAIIILIIGTAMLRNYDQMKSMQETLNYLSKNMKEVQAIFSESGPPTGSKTTETTDISDGDQAAVTPEVKDKTSGSKEDSLDVEVVPGNVKPLADGTEKKGDSEVKQDNNSEPSSDKELAGETKNNDVPKAGQNKTTKQDDNTKTAKAAITYYVVKEGDTLADISYKLYKTYSKVDKIMELNGISDQNLIYAGQKLIVP